MNEVNFVDTRKNI